jgi:hypothetical protein
VKVPRKRLVALIARDNVLFAGFRDQPVYAFVDGVLVAQGVA